MVYTYPIQFEADKSGVTDMQYINLGSGITSEIDGFKPMSHYESLSFKLRAARLAWLNAKAMVSMANKGLVSKSQAFKVMNQVRREYKATIQLTEACLGIGRANKIMEQATADYIETVKINNGKPD